MSNLTKLEILQAQLEEQQNLLSLSAEDGDLRENAAYEHAASEIERLMLLIAAEFNAKDRKYLEKPAGTEFITYGSIVTIKSDYSTQTITIVRAADADISLGRISTASPVGAALLGKKGGDTVSVNTLSGRISYYVVQVL